MISSLWTGRGNGYVIGGKERKWALRGNKAVCEEMSGGEGSEKVLWKGSE